MTQLQSLQFSQATYLVNKDAGYFPYFQLILKTRVKKKKAVNVAITGEAGDSKSYVGWTLARLVEPRFTVDQIVYYHSDYMKVTRKLPMGWPIELDEPSYVLSKRDWYKEINKVLVETMESQRFKVHPVFIPVINQSLLDKTIRTHLLQFQVIVRDRGIGDVYRLQASQFEEKLYRHWICEIRYPLLGACPKEYGFKESRDSCLGCRKLNVCPTFRAQYERKKASVQEKRYEQAEQQAEYLETKRMTDSQLEEKLYVIYREFTDEEGNIDADLMRIVAKDKLNFHIGHSKAYKLKKALIYHHPDEFQ